MKKLIKDFKMFPSGAYGYNLSRELKTKEDMKQYKKELAKKYHNKTQVEKLF